MIVHNTIKQNLALFVTILYLINSFSNNKYNKYFTKLALLIGLIFPILLIIDIPFNFFILNGWRKTNTYIIYYFGFIVIYTMLKVKGFNSSYSLIMGINAITACGYLYEVPRYYHLLGLDGILRRNGSMFTYYDFGVMSTIIMILLLIKVGYRNPTNLISSIVGYSLYLISYYNPILYDLRLYFKLSFYRIIVLTLLIILIEGLKDNE